MQFLRRNRFFLLTIAVLMLASVNVVRGFLARQSAHIELREDFLLLWERGETRPAERYYQLLIQQLPDLNEKSLVDDLQRTSLLVGSENEESLVWKYHVSVGNELRKRSSARLERVRQAEHGR